MNVLIIVNTFWILMLYTNDQTKIILSLFTQQNNFNKFELNHVIIC
jgi:hypothetical protein